MLMPADVDYILDAINVQFPGVHLTRDDIISTYAGVRPLVAEGGARMPSRRYRASTRYGRRHRACCASPAAS